MIQAGLVDHWIDTYKPKPAQCLLDPNSPEQIFASIRYPDYVNLKNLYSAFVTLIFGSGLTFLVFIGEWITKLKLLN